MNLYTIYVFILDIIDRILKLFEKCDKYESIIVDDNGIVIVEIIPNIDSYNVTRYLKNHILLEDISFVPYDYPVVVKFKYLDKIYKIHLNQLRSSKDDHTEIIESPKILLATLGDEDVTETIREYHGNTQNFYAHIPDVANPLELLLEDLHIYDMMGNNTINKLKKNIS